MVAGAPFPGVLDWTWGEINEFIACREEARTEAMRDQAAMLFRFAFLQNGIMNAKRGKRFDIMEEFPFLWSDDERKEVAQARQEDAIFAAMMAMNDGLAAQKAREAGIETAGQEDESHEEGGAEDEWKRKLSE